MKKNINMIFKKILNLKTIWNLKKIGLWYFYHGKNIPKVLFLGRNIENYIYNFLHVYAIGKKTFDAQLSVILLLSISDRPSFQWLRYALRYPPVRVHNFWTIGLTIIKLRYSDTYISLFYVEQKLKYRY